MSHIVAQSKRGTSYLCPLFWQHGESKEILLEEIDRMHEKGIGSFVLEPRPHPDYLGYGWWRDVDFILEAARERNMGVWFFDDGTYPSGVADGLIEKLYPSFTKRYIAEYHVDAMGPRKGVTLEVAPWVPCGDYADLPNTPDGADQLLHVLVARRTNGTEGLDPQSVFEVTDRLHNGRIVLDLPEGSFRIFMIYKTRNGAEEHTRSYVNPLSKEAVGKFIEVVYAEHYRHYADEFGKTIKGFFTDEPRFGNAAGYEGTMWHTGVVYPYADDLVDELSREFGEDFVPYLPLLWNNESERCADVHYTYMNVVSRRFGENFTGQIGDWCRAHNVKLIGHVVEDNGVHARLGYGPGHYFRVMEGLDCAGLDIVYQIWPQYREGRHLTPFGYLDARFYYWGLCKMASSAAHIDPKKDGVTMAEIFGAYGWQLGLKGMKWLTDHVGVRGVNFLVPHAFTPVYPDPDCPPHFYARGQNVQWPYFQVWSDYANRVCTRLNDGVFHANAAVLYHAEAEWGGAYEPFEQVVEALNSHQIDCDVVPADYVADGQKCAVKDGKLVINGRAYDVLILPYAAHIPQNLTNALVALMEQKLPVVFMSGYPESVYLSEDPAMLDAIRRTAKVLTYDELIPWMRANRFYDVLADHEEPLLSVCHYDWNGHEQFFLVNENTDAPLDVQLTLPDEGNWVAYDAMNDRMYRIPHVSGSTYELKLGASQSIFWYRADADVTPTEDAMPIAFNGREQVLTDGWTISADDKAANEKLSGCTTLCNLSLPELLPDYSGTVTYRHDFTLDKADLDRPIYLDLGEAYEIADVTLNGQPVGVRILPPYHFDLSGLAAEENHLEIRVTNTMEKRLGRNIFDRGMVQDPSGLLGDVRVIVENP